MFIKTLLHRSFLNIMKHKRVWLGAILLVSLILLMAYSSIEYDNKDPNIIKDVLTNFDKYNNTRISFVAEVREINETSQRIIARIEEPPYTFIQIKTTAIEDSFKVGDIIEVFGVFDGRNHVTAERIWIHEQWKDNLIYLRSIPAIPFVFYLFFRTWRFNKKTFRFERRTEDA